MRGACRGCRVWHFRQLEISPGSLGSRLTVDFVVVFILIPFFVFAIDSCSALGLAEQEKQAAGREMPRRRNWRRLERAGKQTHDAPVIVLSAWDAPTAILRSC